MKSRTGNSPHFFATIALLIGSAVTLCAQSQQPTTQQRPATSSAASQSSQTEDKAAATSSRLLPIRGVGTANFIPLWTGNYTVGNSLLSQSGNGLNVAGAVTAISFTGNGAALTGVNASTLGGQSSSNFAQLGASNTFTAGQTINGNLNLTGYVNSTLNLQGNLTDANGQEGANVLGGFAGNAAYPGNSIAPGVIGATIGGGGGVYDPSLLPLVQRAVKRSLQRNQVRGGKVLRNPFAQRSSQGDSSEPAEQPEAPEQAPGLTSGPNIILAFGSTIAGGLQNTDSGILASVGGGFGNTASGSYSTVAGGDGNTASGNEDTVAGGTSNTASGGTSFVGGGSQNIASGSGDTIAGGFANESFENPGACCGTIGGGVLNTVGGGSDAQGEDTVGGGIANFANGGESTVGGGSGNTASGAGATVPGGYNNVANGFASFAAGCLATANYSGSFVWSGAPTGSAQIGSGDCAPEQDTGPGQFVAQATGGFTFFTSLGGNSGALLAPGSGSWSSFSDRNAKDNFAMIDSASLLAEIAALPISTWNYKAQDTSIRHMGPTAQDFRAAFGLGEDDKHISNIDSEGVALAAVQALYKLNQEKDREISELKEAVEKLKAEVEQLADSAGKR